MSTRPPLMLPWALLIGISAAVLSLTGCAAASLPAASSSAKGQPSQSASLLPSSSSSSSPTPSPMPSRTEPKSIVFIGDSIMSGFHLDSGNDWPTIMAQQTGNHIKNLACPGAGFVVSGDCGQNYAGLVTEAIAIKPDVVVIQASDNDWDQGEVSIDDNTLSTLQQLHQELPGTEIIALSTLKYGSSDWQTQISITSDALSRAASTVGAQYIDIGQPLDGHPDDMQDDDEHPNVAGQHLLASVMRNVLAQAGVVSG